MKNFISPAANLSSLDSRIPKMKMNNELRVLLRPINERTNRRTNTLGPKLGDEFVPIGGRLEV